MSNTRYYFLPSVRQGLAVAIKEGADAAHRAQIDVILRAAARKKGAQGEDSEDITQALQLYGPGDILGFHHERIVVRHHPEPDVGDFEPNYFPCIEFADADFVWRFTADKAEDQTGKLTPWITLIVLVSESQGDIQKEFTEGPRSDRNLPRHIIVNRSALPDLQYAWRWAYVHITGEEIIDEGIVIDDELEETLRNEPECGICRLMCPRRLATKTPYTAFIVPTFKLGVLAGLGFDLDPNIPALDFAWKKDDSDQNLPYYVRDNDGITLPYYYRWEFGTGLRGDFEHLVRLLEPRKLSGLGIRNIDCEWPGYGVRGVNRLGLADPESHYLGMEGALKSVDTQYTPWGRDPENDPPQPARPLQVDLATNVLNRPRADQIRQYVAPNVTETSAIDDITVRLMLSGTAVRITWHTSMAATSRVDYGETADYGDRATAHYSANDAGARQNHVLTLTDRVQGETYHFKIVAEADDDAVFETPDCTFEMPPLPSVVPPIYGRWHRARNGVVAQNQEEWLDVLNLDPRHRAAGGLGSEVIRKQQEPLMASAWEQLGAIESANDVLRRAQFGRDSSRWLHQRLDHLPTEDFLRVTSPVQKRVIVKDVKITVTHYLGTQSRIPAAALDPALRRIMRPRGPIRKRQGAGRSVDLLTRLASGEVESAGFAPKPLGTSRLCDISQRLKQSLVPTVSLTADPTIVGVGEATTLTWSSTNTTACTATGVGWTGPKACSGSEQVVPFPDSGSGTTEPGSGGTVEPGPGPGPPPNPVLLYTITCNGPLGSATATVPVVRADTTPGTPGGGGGGVTVPGEGDVTGPGGGDIVGPGTALSSRPVTPSGVRRAPTPPCKRVVSPGRISGAIRGPVFAPPVPTGPDAGVRFCDGFITCELIQNTVNQNKPFEGVSDIPDPETMVQVACGTIDDWLDKQPEATEPEPPIQSPGFVDSVKQMIFPALDPNLTVVERTKKRLQLAGDLAERFEKGTKGDPLDTIMWAPEFPQSMYEPLRDISHDLLLPGVEKIPQNTLGLLETNRRFLESYMCGCNHEFAGELLWRGYPTDQRGSYFRQFWDVSEYVPRESELQILLGEWLRSEYDRNSVVELPREEKTRITKHYLDRYLDKALESLVINWLTQPGVTSVDDLTDEQKRVINLQTVGSQGVSELGDNELNELAAELIKQDRLAEKLRDITPLVKWQDNRLGINSTRPQEDLVLVVRGDLLKRYPNALIYAIDAVHCDGYDGEPVPGLREYLKDIKDSDGNVIEDDEEIEARIQEILSGIQRVFPVFQAKLPPDLTFFGFPFSEEDARGVGAALGKYFVIEEQVLEPRFGLDLPTDEPLERWDDLSWAHFGLEDADGSYLDSGTIVGQPSEDDSNKEWNDDDTPENPASSSAMRAWITLQKPVRIAVHAKQMLPDVAT